MGVMPSSRLVGFYLRNFVRIHLVLLVVVAVIEWLMSNNLPLIAIGYAGLLILHTRTMYQGVALRLNGVQSALDEAGLELERAGDHKYVVMEQWEER